MLEAALDCVFSIDGRGRVTYLNPSAERIFGYSRDEVVGRELAEVIVPPAQRDAHRRGLMRCVATGESRILDQRIELMAMRADGSEFPVELRLPASISRRAPASPGSYATSPSGCVQTTSSELRGDE